MKLGKYKIIDAHVHVWDSTQIEQAARLMAAAELERWAIVCTSFLDRINANPQALYCKSRYPEQTYVFGGMDYTIRNSQADKKYVVPVDQQVDRLIAMGADGVKMLEGKPTFHKVIGLPLTDKFYAPWLARLEETGFPILWHVADPEEFWDAAACPVWAKKHHWDYTDGSFIEKEAIYAEVEEVLKRYPRLKIIFAHFYFLSADLPRAARFLDEHPAIAFDLTPGVEMYHNFTKRPAEAREFFLQYQERLIFGTDNADFFFANRQAGVARVGMVRRWLETDDLFEVPPDPVMTPDERPALKGIALPPTVCAKIYAQNFERYAGKTPRQLVPDLVLKEIERINKLQAQLGLTEAAKATTVILAQLSSSRTGTRQR